MRLVSFAYCLTKPLGLKYNTNKIKAGELVWLLVWPEENAKKIRSKTYKSNIQLALLKKVISKVK
jgi:hypothetical protein